jgi:2-C-methyl-D-erythritol 4-phosphate cytidylyltransferase
LSVWAVLAAAGRGERLGSERPKAFAKFRDRPLLAESLERLEASDWIDQIVIVAPPGWDGAVPALPLADTIKRVRAAQVVETLPRDELVAVQTPQAFLAPVLRDAVAGELAGATDCASLVEARGGRVTTVPGDSRLVKVTDAADLELVASLL